MTPTPEQLKSESVDIVKKEKDNFPENNEKNEKTFNESVNSIKTPEEFKEEQYFNNVDKLLKYMQIQKVGTSSQQSYYIEGWQNMKESELKQAFHGLPKETIVSLIDEYNANKKVEDPQIDKNSFLSTFETKKPIKVIGQYELKEGSTVPNTMVENQKVSEMFITPQQQKKIIDNFYGILNHADQNTITTVDIQGKADATEVTEEGKKIAEKTINDCIKELKNKGFEYPFLTPENISQHPDYDPIKEKSNPGNYLWSYARALLQISHLPQDILNNLKSSNIKITLKSDVENKGDEYTGANLDIYYKSEKKPKTEELNQVVRQFTNTDFFLKYYDEKGKEHFVGSKYYGNIDQKNPNNSIILNQRNDGNTGMNGMAKSYIDGYLNKPGVAKQNTESLSDNTYFIVLKPEDVQSRREKFSSKEISFNDLYDLYVSYNNGNVPQNLQNSKQNFDRYQSIVNQITESKKEKKISV